MERKMNVEEEEWSGKGMEGKRSEKEKGTEMKKNEEEEE